MRRWENTLVTTRTKMLEYIFHSQIYKKKQTFTMSQAETDKQDGNILQGMRFLCAEDNAMSAEILTELLKIEGAECTICENVEEILKTFEQSVPGDYDRIFMDVQMPVMNGYEATKAIRRIPMNWQRQIRTSP